MKEEQFIKANSNFWRELEELSLKINKKGIKGLTSQEVKRFLYLFRLCSHHLAFARTHYPGSNIINYLNSLAGKSHSHAYAVKKIPALYILKYIFYDFPNILKEYRWYIAGSFGFFLFGVFLSLFLVLTNSNNAAIFLPQSMVDGIKSGQAGGGAQWNYPLMSSYIMTNNIGVSLKAFALGISLGLGTMYILFYNGATLGALTGLIYLYGNPTSYWSLILPHGVFELTAIFISGASGLIIAKSMILTGELSWKHSIIDGAKRAVSLLSGVIFMLIIAGIIEGFFTPLNISPKIKLSFAAVTSIILVIYFSIPYFIKNNRSIEKQHEKQHENLT